MSAADERRQRRQGCLHGVSVLRIGKIMREAYMGAFVADVDW
jgi:hypothetical protein